jgi:hypothetical protein
MLFNQYNITDEFLPPPNEIQISIDFSLRELTFSWSPVAPDCPAIHYNILASNCGSCPTTTNHTNATCTNLNVSLNDTVCTFAVQTVVCGNITGNVSDPISITFYASEPPPPTPSNVSQTDNPGSHNLDPTENMMYPIKNQGMHNLNSTETVRMHSLGTNTEYIISIGLLATAMMVCVVVFIIVTCIILIRNKAKIEAALQQSASQGETINMEPMYEYINGPLPSESDMNTQVNVAYGESDVNTQANIAYGHTQAATAR